MFLYKQVTLSEKSSVQNALLKIYGIGPTKSFIICSRVGLAFHFPINCLNYYYFGVISILLDDLVWLEVRIKRQIHQNISLLVDIGCYKGLRHSDSLPVRGQRSRTNAQTRKKSIFLVDG